VVIQLERKKLNQFEAPVSELDWLPEREPEKDEKTQL
jgi:hypothetical protein